MSDYALLETKIEYVFKDKDLLLNAMYTSFANNMK